MHPALTFAQLVDPDELQHIADALHAAAGIPFTILDLNGTVLVRTGWQRICTDFHRKNSVSAARCRESDARIYSRLGTAPYIEYRCANGMWDIAMPIIVEGTHLATLFVGQFFYDDERPDEDFFRNQARELGFDEADYLAALAEVPFFSRDKMRKIMDFNLHLVRFISHQALAKLQLEAEMAERKRAEEELHDQLTFIRTLTDAIPTPIFFKDQGGSYRLCNTAFEQFLGLPREEIIGRSAQECAPEPFGSIYRDMDQKLMHEGGLQTYELKVTTPDGAERTVVLIKTRIGKNARHEGIIGIIMDITDRMQAERESRRLRTLLDRTFNSMPSMLVGVTPDGTVTQWNQRAEAMAGSDTRPAEGMPLAEAFPALGFCLNMIRSALATGQPQTREKVRRTTAEGAVRYEDIIVFPLAGEEVDGAVIRVDDVTERTRIEDLMIQTEKMMSVGGLAAGMAHEINNPLGIILQCSQNIERRFDPHLPANTKVANEFEVNLEGVRQYIEKRGIGNYISGIRDAASRAARIVRNMLDFSRKSESTRKPEDVNALLDRTLELASSDYDLKKNYDFRLIHIDKDYAPDLPQVEMVQTEIEQVVLNVLRNAAEAMAMSGMTEQPHILLRSRRDGNHVRIEISDNGPGLGESTRKRIFEPFFTTKEPGVGTGLGLSVSYFIITNKHRGDFFVESEEGHGATFIIRLPI
ncbi:PAS domain S-box-containing protein [Desulfobaculum xiamenense]|uniref:histidine kinase n=1 Tax=Desulfobaculum xiamenense TaxID=995050 RepID=A0A846QQ40_9BACT|nr:PocR ligand-binding domain-containing protein [Desulfobaculum xiamenense]NJB68622.1 PAS domain S-box-containing protein [Desulfobaculum xiamenense]